MGGEYKKYLVEMQLQGDGYRLWKHGADAALCFVETYKDKRAIYFSAANLYPSTQLMSEAGKEYHLLLLGSADGKLLHKDFGSFVVGRKGEGSIFKKFTGPEITCYTHCLLLALARDGGTETIYTGTLPFYEAPEESQSVCRKGENAGGKGFPKGWECLFRDCKKQGVSAFSRGKDETEADWYRIEDWTALPDCIKNCEAQARRFGHLLVGERDGHFFAAVPGRFLREEQPCRREEFFTLWQPMRGGEGFFEHLDDLHGDRAEEIFGYWICGIDVSSGKPFSL